MVTKAHKVVKLLRDDGPGAASFWLLVDKGARMVLGLLFNLALATSLGPVLAGQYSQSIALAYVLFPLFTLGINDLLISEYAKSAKPGAVLGSSMVIKFMGSMACIIGLWLFQLWQGQDIPFIKQVTLWLTIVTFVIQIFDGSDYYFQQLGNVRKLILMRVISQVFFTSVKLTLIYGGASWFWVMLCLPLEFFTVYGGMAIISPLFRNLMLTVRPSWELVRFMWQRTRVLLPATLASNTFMRMDVLLIGYLGSDYFAGIYGSTIRFSEPWVLVPYIISGSFSGHYYILFLTSKETARSYWQQFSGVLLVLAVVVIIATMIGAPLVGFLLGPKYSGSASLLTLHVTMLLFSAAGSFSWPWIVAHQRTDFWLYKHLFGIVLLAVLGWILWPLWGIYGVALSVILSNAVIHWLLHGLFPATRDLWAMQCASIRFVNWANIKALLSQRQT